MLDETTGQTDSNDAGNGGMQADSSAQQAEPTVLDVTDDALIRVKGQEKPVKFGEYSRGFQSQATKAAQEAARLRNELAQRDARLQEIERQRQAQAAQQGGGNRANEVLEAIRSLQYLDGESAAAIVQGIHGEFQNRDRILLGTLKELANMKQAMNHLMSNHSNSTFDSQIKSFLSENGYPVEAEDLAKEIFLAYEGEDVWSEFPQIFAQRWQQIERAFEARRQAALDRNRKIPFVPGKGGNAGPRSPLQFKGNESPNEVADSLWDALQGRSGT